jgi:hypothetical protein
MGATAHFIDDNQNYQSINLFCIEFVEAKKKQPRVFPR